MELSDQDVELSDQDVVDINWLRERLTVDEVTRLGKSANDSEACTLFIVKLVQLARQQETRIDALEREVRTLTYVRERESSKALR